MADWTGMEEWYASGLELRDIMIENKGMRWYDFQECDEREYSCNSNES